MADKKALRKSIRDEIARLPEEYIESSDKGIFNNIISLPAFEMAGTVFAYYSVGREVATHALIAHCLETGKKVCLPVVLGEGVMIFARYEPKVSAMEDGSLNIPQPDESAERVVPQEGDVILVPGLCYDPRGHRMGQGGGYYDRFLPGCAAYSIGVGRERLMRTLELEPHDFPVNCVVTDERVRII